MAFVKISDLPAGSSVATTDLFESSQGTTAPYTSRRVTGTQVRSFVLGGPVSIPADTTNFYSLSGGGTGTSPSITATGADANLSANIQAKGTGSVILRNESGIYLNAYAGSSTPANRLDLSVAGSNGGGVSLSVQGGGTEEGLRLQSKGQGRTSLTNNLGTLFSAGPNGAITPVNNILAIATATNSPPALVAEGSDTNIGLTLSTKGTGAFQIDTNGTEKVRVTSGGDVGVGTSAPATKLEVDGVVRSRASGGAGGKIELNNPDNAAIGGNLDVGSADVTRWYTVRNNTIQQMGQLVGTGGILTMHTGSSERMRIDSAGNVGIGTSSPAVRLAISSTDAVLLPVGTTGERPTGATGLFRYNSSLNFFEGRNNADWVSIVTTTDTQTVTNKRINPRIGSVASAATITPTADTADQYNITALATAATIATPSGTPVDGQRLILRFEDNGTNRALTWTTSSGAYRAVGVTLPTTTVATKVTYVGCVYNAQDGFWDVIAVTTQA